MNERTGNPGPPREPRAAHLPSLTPLRGLAALWVVAYHFGHQYFPSLHSERYTHLIEKGYLAVDLFFFLSGFVLTHVYCRDVLRLNGRRYRSFLVARIARLYPLHVSVLFLFVATAVATSIFEYVTTGAFAAIPLEGPQSLSALIANLLMLQGLAAGHLSWNYPSWSISVEFLAYLCFPWVVRWVWTLRIGQQWLVTLALVAILCGLAIAEHGDFNQWDGPQALLRCMPEFLLGSLLWLALKRRPVRLGMGDDRTALSLAIASLVALHLGAPDILIVATLGALVMAVAANRGWTSTLLNVRPLEWLGEVSYALYLVHGLVQYVTTLALRDGFRIDDPSTLAAAPSFALMCAMVAASLGLAAVAHVRIEVPGRLLLKRMANFGERQAG